MMTFNCFTTKIFMTDNFTCKIFVIYHLYKIQKIDKRNVRDNVYLQVQYKQIHNQNISAQYMCHLFHCHAKYRDVNVCSQQDWQWKLMVNAYKLLNKSLESERQRALITLKSIGTRAAINIRGGRVTQARATTIIKTRLQNANSHITIKIGQNPAVNVVFILLFFNCNVGILRAVFQLSILMHILLGVNFARMKVISSNFPRQFVIYLQNILLL